MNTDRGSKAWKAGKERKIKRVRPILDRVQRIQFLELYAQMSSNTTFERKLGLSSADVAFYKRELDVESPDEARRLANKLKIKGEDEREAKLLERTQQVREAEEIAQARLEALEAKKRATEQAKPRKKIDINKVRQEDADRQKRFAAQHSAVSKPEKEWRLSMEQGAGSESEQIDRFRRAIIYHGLGFTVKTYGATTEQIKYEAARLGLKINWDIVRK